MLLLKMIYRGLVIVNESLEKDKRVSFYPFVGKPWGMIGTIALYLMVVLRWGPKYMANRKPYKVDGVMKFYNMVQIILNCVIFYESLKYTFLREDFSMFCQKYDHEDTRPQTMKLARPSILYYLSKCLDLLDTIFFLLRKKDNQVTFLHVYHHSIMIFASYIYCTFLFSSHFSATGVINSFIHICMYTYYLVAVIKPKIDLKPWKRTLTSLQLLQFVVLAMHLFIPILNNYCKLPMFWLLVAFVQNAFMIVLFGNFYYRTYISEVQQEDGSHQYKTH